jgi:DNA-binding NtrC family response regulator
MDLSDFLQSQGYKTIEASDAAEAMQMVRSYAVVLDVVLTDIRMPGPVDGFALARWINQNRPQMRVIFCTAQATQAEAEEQGCGDIPMLKKPCNRSELLIALETFLNDRSDND